MAGASLLALLDDIATLLDDISAMTQVAAKKTAAVMGDDLAVNAEKVIGVRPSRELPVVWAVAKGSLVNKAILVPIAVLLANVAPWLITPLLVCGGLFLCFEGAEKVFHSDGGESEEEKAARRQALVDGPVDLAQMEKTKVRGAVRTDFILSLEIIVLTLSVVEQNDLATQFGVLAGISVLMVAFVYGLVAGIVKIDDLGFHLIETAEGPTQRTIGQRLVEFAPKLMKSLSVLGTIAMFLVGGGILLHAAHGVEAPLFAFAQRFSLPESLVTSVAGGVIGLLAGGLLVGMISLISRWRGQPAGH